MKGKYGQRAAVRREVAEVEASEAAYQRQIVRLTAERDEARVERDKARKDWAAEVRLLKAQVREGASTRVEALIRELEKVRSERDGLKRNVERLYRYIDLMELRSDPAVAAIDKVVDGRRGTERGVTRSELASRLQTEQRRLGMLNGPDDRREKRAPNHRRNLQDRVIDLELEAAQESDGAA